MTPADQSRSEQDATTIDAMPHAHDSARTVPVLTAHAVATPPQMASTDTGTQAIAAPAAAAPPPVAAKTPRWRHVRARHAGERAGAAPVRPSSSRSATIGRAGLSTLLVVLSIAIVTLSGMVLSAYNTLGVGNLPQLMQVPGATATVPGATATIPGAVVRSLAQTNPGRNAHMGCAVGAPPPMANVVGTALNYANPSAPVNEVALTFDDGPTPYSTPAILDFLEQSHTPATFFDEGSYISIWPYLVQREWKDGFAIGLHSWDHPQMTHLSLEQRQFQFGATVNAFHNALGSDACVWFWRPPYGDYNGTVVQEAQGYGLTTVMWDVDPSDWSRPGVNSIANRVLSAVHPGAIVLMHDGPALRDQTANALPLIVAGLQQRGLTPVTLPRLLADSHYAGVHTISAALRPPDPAPTPIPTPLPTAPSATPTVTPRPTESATP